MYMKETKDKMNRPDANQQITAGNLDSLINQLGSKDKSIRKDAHISLAAIGEPGVKALVKALSDPRDEVRRQAGQLLDEIQVDWTDHADDETLKALVADLGSQDGIVRARARQALVSIGGKSVTMLSNLLKSKDQGQRWEAAKALGQIGDRSAVGALTRALGDEIFDVRWLAAEGLIGIGQPSVAPLLHALIEHSDSIRIREGAHHVFNDLHNPKLKIKLRPVLAALEDTDLRLEVPLAAEAALKSFE
jgi:HEAT repeat protein